MSGKLGPGTKNITVNIDSDLYVEFHKLISVSGARTSDFLRALISFAVEENVMAREKPEDVDAWYEAIEKQLTPVPKKRMEIILTRPPSIRRFIVDEKKHPPEAAAGRVPALFTDSTRSYRTVTPIEGTRAAEDPPALIPSRKQPAPSRK